MQPFNIAFGGIKARGARLLNWGHSRRPPPPIKTARSSNAVLDVKPTYSLVVLCEYSKWKKTLIAQHYSSVLSPAVPVTTTNDVIKQRRVVATTTDAVAMAISHKLSRDVTSTCCNHDNGDVTASGHVSSQSLMYSQVSGEMTPPLWHSRIY